MAEAIPAHAGRSQSSIPAALENGMGGKSGRLEEGAMVMPNG